MLSFASRKHYSGTQPQSTLCPTRFGCQGNTRAQCEGIIRQYQEQIDDDIELIEEEPESHDPQILRHVVLLILLLCSMFVVVKQTNNVLFCGVIFGSVGHCFMYLDAGDGKNLGNLHRTVIFGCNFKFWPKYHSIRCFRFG